MQPQQFIRKWSPGGPAHELNERAGAQAHFIDLCRVLGVPEPADPENYCFERGVTKTGSASQRTDGFADVWLRGHFAWEYKAPGKSLEGALRQLRVYALPLESPPDSIARRYMASNEALEQLLGRNVDLMTDHPIENPFFRRAVDATRCEIYVRAPAQASA